MCIIEVSPVGPPAPPPTIQPARREDTIYSSIRVRPRAIPNDSDEWDVYSTALINRYLPFPLSPSFVSLVLPSSVFVLFLDTLMEMRRIVSFHGGSMDNMFVLT